MAFVTRSMLGAALLGQREYAEATPMLLAGYERLKRHEHSMPAHGEVWLTQCIEKLVGLYEATDQPQEAAKWRAELQKSNRRAGNSTSGN